MSGQGSSSQSLGPTYVPIHKSSRRWNKKPIITGSSDCDDRGGGGASLTATGGGVSLNATSDVEDNAQSRPSPHRHENSNNNYYGNKGKRVAVPPSKLRGDAKPFNASASTETTPSAASNSLEANTVQASDAGRAYTSPQLASPAASREVQAATRVLMDMYNKTRERARSGATDASTRSADRGRGRGHTNAIHSSPLKAVKSNIENNIRYDAQAPVFMPAGNGNNSGFANAQQVHPSATDTQQYHGTPKHGFASGFPSGAGSAQGTPTGARRGNQHDQNGGIPHANFVAPNGPNTPTFIPGIPYKQQEPGQLFPGNGGGGTGGLVYNNSQQMTDFPAHGVADYHQYPMQQQQQQQQQFPNAVYYQPPVNNELQNQASQQPIGIPFHQTHHDERTGAMMPMGHGNGQQVQVDRSHYDPYMNGAPPHGASWNNNEQSNMSTALVRRDSESAVVGPIEFEMPDRQIMAQRSEMLQTLTEHGRPALEDLMDPKFLPFVESYKFSGPSDENGVVVVRNIPYETTRGEIIALLGRSSRILNDRQEPIHIIMDRVTSKTQDAYCELSSLNAAIELVNKFRKGSENGRVGRLGSRIVDVELSSQSNLMVTLFPSSKNGVKWIGASPQIVTDSEYSWENFKSFFTEEEMVMLGKHVENPQRSLYARICPERPYECMISTLRKSPWYMAEYITIKQRHSVYEACLKMIDVLVGKLNNNGRDDAQEHERLTPQLLDRLITSAMLCPGFTVVQKHNIAIVGNLSEERSREFNQPRFPDSWRHQWTLVPKPGLPIDVLEWYISVIRIETTRVVGQLDISQRMPFQERMQNLDGYWGFFWVDANFPVGRDWDNMSLAECSRMEWQAIERILTRAVRGGTIPPSYTSGPRQTNSTANHGASRMAYTRY